MTEGAVSRGAVGALAESATGEVSFGPCACCCQWSVEVRVTDTCGRNSFPSGYENVRVRVDFPEFYNFDTLYKCHEPWVVGHSWIVEARYSAYTCGCAKSSEPCMLDDSAFSVINGAGNVSIDHISRTVDADYKTVSYEVVLAFPPEGLSFRITFPDVDCTDCNERIPSGPFSIPLTLTRNGVQVRKTVSFSSSGEREFLGTATADGLSSGEYQVEFLFSGLPSWLYYDVPDSISYNPCDSFTRDIYASAYRGMCRREISITLYDVCSEGWSGQYTTVSSGKVILTNTQTGASEEFFFPAGMSGPMTASTCMYLDSWVLSVGVSVDGYPDAHVVESRIDTRDGEIEVLTGLYRPATATIRLCTASESMCPCLVPENGILELGWRTGAGRDWHPYRGSVSLVYDSETKCFSGSIDTPFEHCGTLTLVGAHDGINRYLWNNDVTYSNVVNGVFVIDDLLQDSDSEWYDVTFSLDLSTMCTTLPRTIQVEPEGFACESSHHVLALTRSNPTASEEICLSKRQIDTFGLSQTLLTFAAEYSDIEHGYYDVTAKSATGSTELKIGHVVVSGGCEPNPTGEGQNRLHIDIAGTLPDYFYLVLTLDYSEYVGGVSEFEKRTARFTFNNNVTSATFRMTDEELGGFYEPGEGCYWRPLHACLALLAHSVPVYYSDVDVHVDVDSSGRTSWDITINIKERDGE